MKDQDHFSYQGSPPTPSAQQGGSSSNDHAPSSPSTLPPSTPSLAHLPRMGPRLTRHPRLRLLLVGLGVLLVLAGGYGIFRVVSSSPHQISSAFQQTHCPFTLGQGLVEGKDVRCGFVVVPEDRSQPKSHSIRLAVAIFKTPNPHRASDPVLVLGGGPGVPQLATTGPNVTARNLTSFAPNRDLILLDQRGVGYSQPSLSCQNNDVQECHDRLVREGINLNAYTTLENAADVHDLVRALGYQQVNLEGISYGTRLVLTVMRLYPADLRSVLLISVFPSQANLYTDQAAVTQHAFDVLFQGCAANAHCTTTYPHLQTTFYRLVSDLNKQPITFEATNPQTGNRFFVQLTGDNLVHWLFDALEDTALLPRLPAVISQIRHQDYTQLSQLYGSVGFPISMGMHYSVECSEDMAYTTPQALTASVQVLAPELRLGMLTTLLGGYSTCQLWNVQPVPAVQKEPVTSSIPTLILEGEYDPVTPPTNGMLAEKTLSRSFFFLFPGVSHGVHTINPCPGIVGQAFLDHPTIKPDASCISSMPEPAFT